MKRKNRRRLAREADIARREARGDFSHLKDPKTGRMMRAPRPQPTLPTVSDDLYADPNAEKDHAYPPYAEMGNAYPPYTPARQQSFGYAASETDSISKGGFYAHSDSVTSLDAFATQGLAPTGHFLSAGDRAPSYRTLGDPDPNPPYPPPGRAESYAGRAESYHAPPRAGLYERSRMANEEHYYAGSEYELEDGAVYGGVSGRETHGRATHGYL